MYQLKTPVFRNTFIPYNLHSSSPAAKTTNKMYISLSLFLKCYSEDTGVSESDKGMYI